MDAAGGKRHIVGDEGLCLENKRGSPIHGGGHVFNLGRTFVGFRQRSRARWSTFPRHFTQVQKRVAHELQHNAAVEAAAAAVVVVTVPRDKLDNSVY